MAFFQALLIFFGRPTFNEGNPAAERERFGVRHVRQLEEAMRLAQQHRALRHMQLSGNADAGKLATQVKAALDKQVAAMNRSNQDLSAFGAAHAWDEVKQNWAALAQQLPAAKAKDSYAAHTAMIERMAKLTALLAAKSGLALDPEVDSYHLSAAMLNTFPGIARIPRARPQRSAEFVRPDFRQRFFRSRQQKHR